jgi:hypothetical protein
VMAIMMVVMALAVNNEQKRTFSSGLARLCKYYYVKKYSACDQMHQNDLVLLHSHTSFSIPRVQSVEKFAKFSACTGYINQ